MANPDFRALFAPDLEPDFKSLFAPDEVSEEEANRTLTPEEQAMVARANEPRFGAGLAKRMEEYQGLSPEDAAAKYRGGWAETIGNAYDTVTDSRKLASAAGNVVEAGVNAVANPRETVRKIGNYYYENPDAGVTDAAFMAFPGRQVLGAVGKAIPERPPSSAMPRSAVRDEAELLKTGGARMEEAKLDPSKVDADAIAGPLAEFREATKTVGLETPMVKAIAKKLEVAYTPRKPGAMSPITKVEPNPRPPVSLTDLHGYQQALDKFINGAGKTEGRVNTQGYEAIALKKAIDKIIDGHPKSDKFKIGKHEYSRGAMSRSMGEILKDAQGRKQWRNGDEAGALGNAIQNFLRKRSNRYALTPDARRKLDILSRDNGGRLAGAFSLNQSFGGNTFARGLELMAGLPPGTGALVGNSARQSRNARLVKEFEQIQEELRAGGPIE
jgi:hypothetical protein